MKMGITYRLFLLILCATGLAVLFLLLIMWWNINRGFHQYLGNVDQKKLTELVDYLGKQYEINGNWDFLKHEPPLWHQFDIEFSRGPHTDRPPFSMEDKKPPMEPPSGNKMDRPPLPPPDRNGHDQHEPMGLPPPEKEPPDPLVILTADKKPVYGSYRPDEKVKLHAVVVHNSTVGFVALMSPTHFLDPMQMNFLSRQKLALLWAAAGMVLIVMLITFPLSRRLVKPIKEMAAATHGIASGLYATRVSDLSHDELGQLARDFNAMALTLEKHEKERRQWVADISHELRTPVAVLQGEIEALMDGIRPINQETIRSLHAETLRLKRLVEDLHLISLSDLGALNYRKENLNLAEVLKESIASYLAEFSRKEIALQEYIDKDIKTTCFADRERLRQLFTNIMENTLRYTDAGGMLRIIAQVSGSVMIIEFQDSKPGVSGQDMEKLFDRLYRVDGSRSRASGGAGLGLAICRNIVEAHEGKISAHSSPLGGLLIRISIPVFGDHT